MLREIVTESEYRIDKYSNEQHPSNENNTKALLYFFFSDPSLTVHLMFLFPSLCSNPFTILCHILEKKGKKKMKKRISLAPSRVGQTSEPQGSPPASHSGWSTNYVIFSLPLPFCPPPTLVKCHPTLHLSTFPHILFPRFLMWRVLRSCFHNSTERGGCLCNTRCYVLNTLRECVFHACVLCALAKNCQQGKFPMCFFAQVLNIPHSYF